MLIRSAVCLYACVCPPDNSSVATVAKQITKTRELGNKAPNLAKLFFESLVLIFFPISHEKFQDGGHFSRWWSLI